MSLQPNPASPPTPRGGRPSLRIGDAERDGACQVLSGHFTAGRLSGDEFDERVEAALAARTERDLRELLADLPTAEGPSAPAPESAVRRESVTGVDMLVGLLGLAAGLCLLLLFLVAGTQYAGFGFFACLGAGTVAAVVTHFIHRALSLPR
ncbi:DUF1707 SHOCT-like domain-containing protein [Micropruina sp.]|uniref:DUF1707 SHOCT-like domain-containing protein n=1 Tax=Micropruina sp. TaxID=2737536 RepID=UPI0039E6EEDD